MGRLYHHFRLRNSERKLFIDAPPIHPLHGYVLNPIYVKNAEFVQILFETRQTTRLIN